MPFISAIVGFISTAFAAVGSFFGAIAATGLGSALIKIGLNVAMRFISKAFFKEEKPASGVNLELEYGERVSRKVMSGLCAVVGHEIYGNTYGSSNKYLQYCYVLSDFPCTSLDRVWINGEIATLGDPQDGSGSSGSPGAGYQTVTSGVFANRIHLKFVDGWQENADSTLISTARPNARWTADHRLDGMAQVHVRQTFDREKLARPANFLFEFKGAVFYDWRKDSTVGGSGAHRFNDVNTWEYSENPIVIAYNYHRGLIWNGDKFCGMDVPASDLPLARWTVAANICDEIVGGAPRYVVSLALDCGPETQHGDNIEALMRSCAGQIIEQVDGIWPLVGADQPVVATLYEDIDFVTGAPVRFQRLRPMNQLVNSVAGVFPDPENQWSPSSYETATDSALVAIDRRTRDVNIDFNMVRRREQAAQLASIFFKENRFEATMSCTVRPRWQILETGDWIEVVSPRFGTRIWLIAETNLKSMDAEGPRCVELNLQERSDAIYDPVSDLPAPVYPLPPGSGDPVNEVLDFAVIASNASGAGGRIVPAIRVSFTMPDDPTIEAVLIEYRVAGVAGQSQSEIFTDEMRNGSTVRLLTNAVVSNTVYEVRHRLITDPARITVPSAWLQVTTPDTPYNDVSVGLSETRDDILSSFQDAFKRLDEMESRVDLLSGNVNINNSDEYLNRTVVAKRVGAVAASIVQEAKIRLDDDTALASLISAVSAEVEGVSASGLFSIEASAGGVMDPFLVRLTLLARASSEDDFAEAGQLIELYQEGLEIKSYIFFTADQMAFLNPSDGNVYFPVEISGGVLKAKDLKVGGANITNLVVDGTATIADAVIGTSNLQTSAITIEHAKNVDVNDLNSAAWTTIDTFTIPVVDANSIDFTTDLRFTFIIARQTVLTANFRIFRVLGSEVVDEITVVDSVGSGGPVTRTYDFNRSKFVTDTTADLSETFRLQVKGTVPSGESHIYMDGLVFARYLKK